MNGEYWAAILDNIADLRDHFDREEQLGLAASPDKIVNDIHSAEEQGAWLLYRCRRSALREQILALLPPKAAVGRYFSRYFNYVDLVASYRFSFPYQNFGLEAVANTYK